MLNKVYKYIVDNEFRFTIFNDRIHIINYDRILSLKNDEIIIVEDNKNIRIIGYKLVLKRLIEKELLVSGSIKKIEVIYE